MGRTTVEKTTVEVEAITSRRATLARWRTKQTSAREWQSGGECSQRSVPQHVSLGAYNTNAEPLGTDWTKAKTAEGAPYYLNHRTRATQWVDPRLDSALQELDCHADVKFAAYRTALKMRDMQVFTRMSKVDLGEVVNSFLALDMVRGSAIISVDAMSTVLLEACAGLPNPASHVEVLLSWFLSMFDRKHTGHVDLRAFKIGLSTLSASWLEEKYRYAFGVYDSNGDGFITQEELSQYLRSTLLMVASIREAWPFGPTQEGIAKAIAECLEVERSVNAQNSTQQISLAAFVQWTMAEPRPLLWIPTLHRIAATENAKHETHCSVCQTFPIVGFRYKVMNRLSKDICQECYWTGPKSNRIEAGAPVKEYCFQSTAKQDVKDFSKRVFGRFRSKKHDNEGNAVPGPPEPLRNVVISNESAMGRSARGRAVSVTDVQPEVTEEPGSRHLQDEHEAIGSLVDRMNLLQPTDKQTPMSGMVGHLDADHKAHMAQTIDDLESENRSLVDQLLTAQDLAAQARSQPDPRLLDQNAELQDKIKDYAMRNKELVDQLRRLRALMANMSGVTASLVSETPRTTRVGGDNDRDDASPRERTASLAQAQAQRVEHVATTSNAKVSLPEAHGADIARDPTENPHRDELLSEAEALKNALAAATTIATSVEPENPVLATNVGLEHMPEGVTSRDRKELWQEQEMELQGIASELKQATLENVSDKDALEFHQKSLTAQLNRLAADHPVGIATVEQRPNLRPTQQVSAQPEVDLGAVAIAAAAIRPPPPQRGYSAERLELDRQELSDRMMKAKMQIESALDMTLRGVNRDNAVAGMLNKLENGYLLCKLVNTKLLAKNLPEVAGVRPKAGDELSVPQKTDNFERFIRGCRSLGLHENDIPSVMELQGLSTEAAATTRAGQRETALRPKALKVAGVVDAIITAK